MILEIRDVLKELLIKAEIDEKHIFFDRAKAEQFNAYPFALIELGGDKKTFSGAISNRQYNATKKKWVTCRRRCSVAQEYRVTVFGKDFSQAFKNGIKFDESVPRKQKITDANGIDQVVRLITQIGMWEEAPGFLLDKERVKFSVWAMGGIFDVVETDAVPKTAKIVVEPRLVDC